VTIAGVDCNNADALINPGLAETRCDGKDNDCNPVTDDNPDGDGDGLLYCAETGLGTSDADADSDDDGLTDFAEAVTYATNPLAWDSDNDYLPDLYEVNHRAGQGDSPPLNALSAADGNTNFEPVISRDTIVNYHEYWNGSDPWAFNPAPDALFPDGPGCYYWGEADGDGYAQATDKSTLANKIAGLPVNYQNVVPDTSDTQDLDADGYIQSGDLTILRNFILNMPVGGVLSRAASLEVVYSPSSSIAVGGTTHVTLRVRNENAANVLYQSGFAVVFAIDPGSTGSATLLGGDGSTAPANRFDVSAPNSAIDGGHASIALKILSPGSIILTASIPPCGSSGIGKWLNLTTLSPNITITGQ